MVSLEPRALLATLAVSSASSLNLDLELLSQGQSKMATLPLGGSDRSTSASIPLSTLADALYASAGETIPNIPVPPLPGTGLVDFDVTAGIATPVVLNQPVSASITSRGTPISLQVNPDAGERPGQWVALDISASASFENFISAQAHESVTAGYAVEGRSARLLDDTHDFAPPGDSSRQLQSPNVPLGVRLGDPFLVDMSLNLAGSLPAGGTGGPLGNGQARLNVALNLLDLTAYSLALDTTQQTLTFHFKSSAPLPGADLKINFFWAGGALLSQAIGPAFTSWTQHGIDASDHQETTILHWLRAHSGFVAH